MLADWTVPTVGEGRAAVHVSVRSRWQEKSGAGAQNNEFYLHLSSLLSGKPEDTGDCGLVNGLLHQIICFFFWAAEQHFCLEWDDLSVQVTQPPLRSITAQLNQCWFSSLFQLCCRVQVRRLLTITCKRVLLRENITTEKVTWQLTHVI